MINKIKMFIGTPFSIVGIVIWSLALPFIGVAWLCGHKYWTIFEEIGNDDV